MNVTDFGLPRVGTLAPGARNAITDVKGVRVGHCTIDDQTHKTGVTVVMPPQHNPFMDKPVASSFVLNGFGKSLGLMQVDELGTIETPIALTNTLNVGLVHDGLVEYMLRLCARDNVECHSVNPVVMECNDASMNAIADRAVKQHHVLAAIDAASEDFAQGAIGAGRGTTCHGFKGGIGSASRLMELEGKTYTLGVLVQTNHGRKADLILRGQMPFADADAAACDKGSVIVVMVTDLPLLDRQIRRVLTRASVGLARVGSFIGHGSGEVFVGFTTTNQMPRMGSLEHLTALNEGRLDLPFRAIAECVEEAVLLSMLAAGELKAAL